MHTTQPVQNWSPFVHAILATTEHSNTLALDDDPDTLLDNLLSDSLPTATSLDPHVDQDFHIAH